MYHGRHLTKVLVNLSRIVLDIQGIEFGILFSSAVTLWSKEYSTSPQSQMLRFKSSQVFVVRANSSGLCSECAVSSGKALEELVQTHLFHAILSRP